MVISPIWKDTYYTTTANSLTYTIELEGNVIYSGKAVKFPDADELRVNINKVCRNYLDVDYTGFLKGEWTNDNTGYSIGNPIREFYLKNDSGTTLETYRFYYCYDYDVTSTTGEQNERINYHWDTGMYFSYAMLNPGNSSSSFCEYVGQPYFSSSFGRKWKKVCAEYVLYYVNLRGAMDSFVIEGNTIKKDNITTYKTDRVFNNNTIEFEENRYISEIKTEYQMSTHMMSDEESRKFAKHLIGSNKVYLQNLKEGWIKPVIITDNSVTYQTYQTNGKKLSQYKINVQESQTKIRR